MALVLKDRVRDDHHTGTGTYTLAGAVTGFEAFSSSATATTYYAAPMAQTLRWDWNACHPVQRWLVPRSYKALTAITLLTGPLVRALSCTLPAEDDLPRQQRDQGFTDNSLAFATVRIVTWQMRLRLSRIPG